jgi:hypothetical protein
MAKGFLLPFLGRGRDMRHLEWVDEIIRRDQLAERVGQLAKFCLWQEAIELCRHWLLGVGVAPAVAIDTQDGTEYEDGGVLYQLLQQIVVMDAIGD